MESTTITNNEDVTKALLEIGKKSKKTNVNNAAISVAKKVNPNTTNKTIATPRKKPLTKTEKLTKEEIQNLLLDYDKVDDIKTVILGTHVRYFISENNENKFRMGGNLKMIMNDHLILRNAVGYEWKVFLKGATFFKKMSIDDIKNTYEIINNKLNQEIKSLKKENIKLNKENDTLNKELEKFKTQQNTKIQKSKNKIK